MPYSYDSDTTDDDSTGMVDNPKLLAIQSIKTQATTSQNNLTNWAPTSTTGVGTQPGESFNAGLTENVWTSPAADEYRTKIGLAESGAEEALNSIVSDLTDAENAIYNAGEDRVPTDSNMATWPNT